MTSPNPYEPASQVRIAHPEWSRDAAIYQINTRQFTDEGTFAAAAEHLARIKELGTTIVWLWPVHEIGLHNRKGKLGSPYAVKDYFSVNPEFGTLDDLRDFVATAHDLGLHVILDWVANHTAWDNPLVAEHPDWYDRDVNGDLRPTPWWDWTDVIDLDYSQPGLRKYMTGAMRHWVVEADIDGFRCDVAGFVPTDFWNNVRRELDTIKPVFLLAEAEHRDLHIEAFDMTYGWSWYDAMHSVATGEAGLEELYSYYATNEKAFPRDAMRMTFVSNHDKNAWEGTEFEQFGDAVEAAIVLSVVGEGMPLVYNGQEAGNTRRIAFFERDPITWRDHPMGELYRRLLALKRGTTALHNAAWGARMIDVHNSDHDHVMSFIRRSDRDQVFAVLNMSASPRTVGFDATLCHGRYDDVFAEEPVTVDATTRLTLGPWAYRVLVRPGG